LKGLTVVLINELIRISPESLVEAGDQPRGSERYGERIDSTNR